MTHAEALHTDLTGLADDELAALVRKGWTCTGTLVRVNSHPDRYIDHDGNPVETTVTTYLCRGCNHTLAIEASGLVRNDYPTTYRTAVEAYERALAEGWDARPHLPTPEKEED